MTKLLFLVGLPFKCRVLFIDVEGRDNSRTGRVSTKARKYNNNKKYNNSRSSRELQDKIKKNIAVNRTESGELNRKN